MMTIYKHCTSAQSDGFHGLQNRRIEGFFIHDHSQVWRGILKNLKGHGSNSSLTLAEELNNVFAQFETKEVDYHINGGKKRHDRRLVFSTQLQQSRHS